MNFIIVGCVSILILAVLGMLGAVGVITHEMRALRKDEAGRMTREQC